MSVYTIVSPEACQVWLERYSLGRMCSLDPIQAGIENTNYFLTTDQGRYVLTLYERVADDRLHFSLEMMEWMVLQGLPCAKPERDQAGQLFSMLLGKPAGVVQRLTGGWQKACSKEQLVLSATNLARMHQAAAQWSNHFDNPRGIVWRDETAQSVYSFLSDEQKTLLDHVLESQRKHELNLLPTLPQGAIHADYFHDNVLFEEERLTGVIDFGFAGCDAYAYDLAIAVNDWCWSSEQQQLDKHRYSSYMQAYCAVRPLTAMEKTVWSWLLERAALRFWLSRLFDLHCPREGVWVHAHDPAHFERILRYHHDMHSLEVVGVLND